MDLLVMLSGRYRRECGPAAPSNFLLSVCVSVPMHSLFSHLYFLFPSRRYRGAPHAQASMPGLKSTPVARVISRLFVIRASGRTIVVRCAAARRTPTNGIRGAHPTPHPYSTHAGRLVADTPTAGRSGLALPCSPTPRTHASVTWGARCSRKCPPKRRGA